MKAPDSFGVWIVGVWGVDGLGICIVILRISPELLLLSSILLNQDHIN